MQLRPYQSECIGQVNAKWLEHRRLLIVLPTGGGKTIIFANLAASLPGRTLILAHREELLQQAIDKIRRATGVHADLERAESHASPDAKIVVASVQTLVRRASSFPKDTFSHIIIDEAHHVAAQTYQTILSHFDSARILGVTATPDRADKRNLGNHFDCLAYEVTLLDLIHQGFLVPIKARVCDVSIDISSVTFSAGDFDSSSTGDVIEPYLARIAQEIAHHGGNKVMVFLPLIRTSMKMVDACREVGLDAEHVDGNSPDRAAIIQRFATKPKGVICNAMLLTEGYDEPSIDTIVVLRPTESRALYTQMVGRGTRLHPGKSHLTILDFLWLTGRHRLVRPTSLFAQGDIAEIADKMTSKQGEFDLEGIVDEAAHVREQKLLRELAKAKRMSGNFIDPVEFAVSINNTALQDYEPQFPWQSQPASEKQISILNKYGFMDDDIQNKGHASAILDAIYSRQKLNLASPKQVRLLMRWGVPNAQTLTFAQANSIISSRIAK